ncbi:MAG TPA: AraC family transcriptional regulator [Candidatus Eremiobacteraceae bacterium]|nr:AraC family transcriptional regulator [Candidatus Eremiobacteraceae bacterium]
MDTPDKIWIRHMGTSEMAFSPRLTSAGRQWRGFDATLFETTGGTVSCPSAPMLNFSMHLGKPIRTARRCDGPIFRRLQSPGDIDLVPVGCPAIWEDSEPSTFLRLDLSQTLVRATAESMGIDPDTLSLAPQMQVRDPMLQHIAWALTAVLETDESTDRLYSESLGTALTAQLLRRYARSSKPKRGLTRRQWQSVVDYVHENLATDLSLAELAEVAGMGSSTFKALFRQTVGMPVHRYVVRQRVEFAMNLLAIGDARLDEVALAAGFVDQSHMARCFRRVVGMTPAAVAREHR